MNKWIQNIFSKRGIKGVEDLTPEEKVEFDKLQKLTERLYKLENEVITVEGVVNFCKQEKLRIEKEWYDNPDNSKDKDIWLKAQHKVLDTLIRHIEPSKAERENIISYLEDKSK